MTKKTRTKYQIKLIRPRLFYALSLSAAFLLGFAFPWFIGRYAGLPVAIAAAVALLSFVGLIVVLRWRP